MSPARVITIWKTTSIWRSPVVGFLDLLGAREDIPFPYQLDQREIVSRLLRDLKDGAACVAIATLGDQSHRTAKSIGLARSNYINLACRGTRGNARMGMSPSSSLPRVDGDYPQYQKPTSISCRARTNARLRIDAASARSKSANEIASQFVTASTRALRSTPMRDIKARRVGKRSAMVID